MYVHARTKHIQSLRSNQRKDLQLGALPSLPNLTSSRKWLSTPQQRQQWQQQEQRRLRKKKKERDSKDCDYELPLVHFVIVIYILIERVEEEEN